MRNATLLYTANALAAAANGAGKTFQVEPGQDLAYVQIYIEADAAVTSTLTVSIQGRLNNDASWVTLDKADHSTAAAATQAAGALVEVIFPVQLMPQMRAIHVGGAGGYAATAGNDVRVWILASGTATRTDSE
jgi:hypothetical protein